MFTAGIGENDAAMRRRICNGMAWAGVTLDERANSRNEVRISSDESNVVALVIPTDEDKMIALHTLGSGLISATR